MKKTIIASAALAIALGTGGSAVADPNPNSETTGNPGQGNQTCQAFPAQVDFKNPGEMWQYGMANFDSDGNAGEGATPKDLISSPGDFDTVGQAIDESCPDPS